MIPRDRSNRLLDDTSIFDAHAFPINRGSANPAIYEAPIVADLVSVALDRFNDMKVLVATNFAQNDVVNSKS